MNGWTDACMKCMHECIKTAVVTNSPHIHSEIIIIIIIIMFNTSIALFTFTYDQKRFTNFKNPLI